MTDTSNNTPQESSPSEEQTSTTDGQSQDKKRRAKAYERIHNLLFLVDIFYTLAAIGIFVFAGPNGGFSTLLADWISSWCPNYWLQVAVYVAFLTTGYMLLLLPLQFYSGYILEHKYELSNEKVASWFFDRIKSYLLNLVFMAIMAEVLFLFLNKAQQSWWLWVGSLWVLFGIILSNVFPVVILPLFYKYKPLEDIELARRLIALAERVKAKILGVYELELSAKTKKANAALAGLGNTKRILLGDTLLQNFTHDEIEVILAHELGHFYYKHIWKLIFFGGAITFGGLYATSLLLHKLVAIAGYDGITAIASFPLFLLCMFVFALISMPINATFSRVLERQADLFALRETNAPKDFISSMSKLADMNLADEEPHPLIEFIMHDHPSIGRRIKMAQQFMQSEG